MGYLEQLEIKTQQVLRDIPHYETWMLEYTHEKSLQMLQLAIAASQTRPHPFDKPVIDSICRVIDAIETEQEKREQWT